MPAVFKHRSYMKERNGSASSDTSSLYTVVNTFQQQQQQLQSNSADPIGGINSNSNNSPVAGISMYQHQQPSIAAGVSRQAASNSSPASPISSVFDSNSALHNHSIGLLGLAATNEYKPFIVGNAVDRFTSTPSGAAAGASVGGLSPGALCAICADKATGKHYGAQSCDGCKGFFRRSVRKNQQYRCRFQRACQIDRDKRNQCRFCRLSKCFRSGMRKEAVQNERDKIGSKNHPNVDDVSNNPPPALHNSFSLQVLHNAEMMSRRYCYELANGGMNGPATNGGRQPAADEDDFVMSAMQAQRIAAAADIVDAMNRQLRVLVEWSKAIPCFMSELPIEDQVAMLRSHAGDHLLVGVTKRSLVLRDTLLLANGAVILRDAHTDSEIYRIANRVIDELVRPMQDLKIDDNECACLKAIVFFDPSARGLKNSSLIRAWRHQVMLTLDDYVRERSYDPLMPVSTPAGRFGELMMLIPVLQNLSMLMVEQLQLVKLVGAAKLDILLQEMLLGGNPTAESIAVGDVSSVLSPSSVIGPHGVSNSSSSSGNSNGSGSNGLQVQSQSRGMAQTQTQTQAQAQTHSLHSHSTPYGVANNSHQGMRGSSSGLVEPSKGGHERMT